jgi:hypothetical protein
LVVNPTKYKVSTMSARNVIKATNSGKYEIHRSHGAPAAGRGKWRRRPS